MTQLIQVRNHATVMVADEIVKILSACHRQLVEDVAPAYGTGQPDILMLGLDEPWRAGAWRFVIADNSDQADALGYHETDKGLIPSGYAFVKTTKDVGGMASVTISHELCEMMGDPFINGASQWADLPSPLFLASELCDPVEDDALGYLKDGVQVSDFVLPAYFVPGSAGPWDFNLHLKGPNTLTDGGYQSAWNKDQGWQQLMGGLNKTRRTALGYANHYSRRNRRNLIIAAPKVEPVEGVPNLTQPAGETDASKPN